MSPGNLERKRSRPVTSNKKFDVLKKNKLAFVIIFLVIFIIVVSGLYIVFFNKEKSTNNISSNPVAVIDTSMGIIKVELYKDKIPNTVNNFINLVNIGFYNGLVFHRVIDDFMIQGGGFYPNGTQKQSPFGPINLEINKNVRHVDGAIAMARTQDPNSATSQFYICDGAQPFLDDNYAVFGIVIEGMDVVRAIASVETTTKFQYYENWPVQDIIINSITIE
ncbi:MAG: peptidylprolyl isomerase [Thermoplasmatota archaeon]|jgi:cyclophilin family peptidyl-prolyl cis-trans isomerase